MRIAKIMGSLLAAVVAIGLIGATSATALSTNNPQWLILSKILAAGETALVHAEATTVQTLTDTGLKIECHKFGLLEDPRLIGSNAPAPGTSEEKIMYSECEVGGGFPACKINGAVPGEIETSLLRDLLVFLTKAGAEKEEAATSGTLFEPKTGTQFALFVLTGTCPLTGDVTVNGTGVLVKNLTVNHEVSHEIEAPAVAIKAYFANEGGVTVEKTGVKITVAGLAATYAGKAKILLDSGEPWGVFN